MYKNILKNIRLEQEITQTIIAKKIGISRGRYSQYETEIDIMPIKHLYIICKYLNVSLDYLFEFSKTNNYTKINRLEIDKIKSGIRIKEFRKSKHITQKELANILNTVQPVIAKYEKGINTIATSFLYDICRKYNISADYLIGITDNPKILK